MAQREKEIDEIMDFLRYSVKQSSTFEGTILFRFKGTNGECVMTYAVDMATDRTVSTIKHFEKESHGKSTPITCEVSISEDDFLWIYSGKASGSDIARLFYNGRLSISGYAFRKVSNFAQSFDFSSEQWRSFYAHQEAMANQSRSPTSKEEVANIGSPSRDFWFAHCRAILAQYNVSTLQRWQWTSSLASIFGEKYIVRSIYQSSKRTRARSLMTNSSTTNDALYAMVSNVIGAQQSHSAQARPRALSFSESELGHFLHPHHQLMAQNHAAWSIEKTKPKDIVDMLDALDANYVQAVKHRAKERFQQRQVKNRIDLAGAGLDQLDKLLVAMGKEGHYNHMKKTKPKHIPGPELLLREFQTHAMEVMDLLKEKIRGRKSVDRIPTPDVVELLGASPDLLVVDVPAQKRTKTTADPASSSLIVRVNRTNLQRRSSKRDFEIPKERLKQKLASLQHSIVKHQQRYPASVGVDDHLVFSDYL